MRLLMRSLLLCRDDTLRSRLATACGTSVGSSVSSAVSSLTASPSPAQSTSPPPATVSSSATWQARAPRLRQ